MGDQRVLARELVAEAVTKLSSVRWSWSLADVDSVARQMGWSVRTPIDPREHLVRLVTGYPGNQSQAFVFVSDGGVPTEIYVDVTGDMHPRFPDRVDAFCTVVAATVQALGEQPELREPGLDQGTWWPAVSGMVVVRQEHSMIRDRSGDVAVALRSPQRVEQFIEWRREEVNRRNYEAFSDWSEEDKNDILSGYPIAEWGESFDPPAVHTVVDAWDEVSVRLAGELSALENAAVLKIVGVDPSAPRYVQLWQNRDAMFVEVSSTAVQGNVLRLPPDREQRIGLLGWSAPTSRDNWRRSLPWPSPARDYYQIADAIVAVWRDVFDVASPHDARYEGFNPKMGEQLVLPELGLQRTKEVQPPFRSGRSPRF